MSVGIIAHFKGGPHDGEMLAVPEAINPYYFPSLVKASWNAEPSVTVEGYQLAAKGEHHALYLYMDRPA